MISKKEILLRLLYLEERVETLEEKSKPKKTVKKTTKKSK